MSKVSTATVRIGLLVILSISIFVIININFRFHVLFSIRRSETLFWIPPHKDFYRTTSNAQTNDENRCPMLRPNGVDFVENVATFESTGNLPWKKNGGEDVSYVTSANKSTFYIIGQRSSYDVGDEVRVRIQARDLNGRNKTIGGDYFRARMHFSGRNASVNPGGILDHGDGTYDVYFTVRWPGRSDISVVLVHPAEAVDVIKRSIRRLPNRLVYSGIFTSPKNKGLEETTQCDVIPAVKGEFCNFSDPREYAPWYCDKPTSLECSDVYQICSHDSKARENLKRITTPKERDILTWMKIPLRSSASLIASEKPDAICLPSNLPLCDLRDVPRDMYAHGYFMQDEWRPFNCKFHHFQKKDICNCLKNKTFYIYSDSTGRQFKEYLNSHVTGFQVTEEGDAFVGPDEIYNPLLNLTVRHAFHGFPLRSGKCSLYENTHYVFNELDKLEGGEHLVILISLWAHFQKTSFNLYEKRILSILDSVDRLLLRSPGTTVIFKGANTRQVGDYFWTVSSTDWIAYQFEIKLRQLLAETSVQVGFLDAWDLTTANHSEDDIHPNDVIVGTMMDMLLTYVCKK